MSQLNMFEEYAEYLINLIKNKNLEQWHYELAEPRFGNDMKFGIIEAGYKSDFHYLYTLERQEIRKIVRI